MGSDGKSEVSKPDVFHTGLLSPDDWQGKWIGETQKREHHIYRKTFSAEQKISRATLFICGLGHY